jgi:hypothetical protein
MSKFTRKESSSKILDLFLPVGYPDTVSTDYTEYQIYDSLQAICSTVIQLLCNQYVLKGIGVGDAQASSLNAMLTMVMQGIVFSLIFQMDLG